MNDVYQIPPRKPIEDSVQLAFYTNIHIQSDEYALWAKKTTFSWEQLKNRDFEETRFCRISLAQFIRYQ